MYFVFQKTADLLQMLVDAERDATSKQVTDGGARTNKCMTVFEAIYGDASVIYLCVLENFFSMLLFTFSHCLT